MPTWTPPSSGPVERDVEIGCFKDMRVYDKNPRSDQVAAGGNIIGTKWIDVNEGDFDNPKICSRLVGKELRTGPDEALFASTPPRRLKHPG